MSEFRVRALSGPLLPATPPPRSPGGSGATNIRSHAGTEPTHAVRCTLSNAPIAGMTAAPDAIPTPMCANAHKDR